MGFMFEDLKVYQKAVDLADAVASLTRGFPRGYYFLIDQLNRAALSVAANLAEGNGRSTKRDRKHFFVISRGSAHECIPMLEVARRQGLITFEQHTSLRRQLETIGKMIAGLIGGMDKRTGR